jgi:hypothetical protein
MTSSQPCKKRKEGGSENLNVFREKLMSDGQNKRKRSGERVEERTYPLSPRTMTLMRVRLPKTMASAEVQRSTEKIGRQRTK